MVFHFFGEPCNIGEKVHITYFFFFFQMENLFLIFPTNIGALRNYRR